MRRTILLCAGGTGGHLFPAEAVATILEQRGWRVELATDRRASGYGEGFPAAAVHVIRSATPSGRGPIGTVVVAATLALSLIHALRLVGRIEPACAVGFGGYPTVPPVLAAKLRRVPTVIHDQNAVLGRANRLLARWARRIATGSPGLKLPARLEAKMVFTGNPMRAAVVEAAKIAYQPPELEGPIRLLIFGGSQGARFLSEIVPAAVEKLRPSLRGRLRIVQQCRGEDLAEVEARYRRSNVDAQLANFFSDLPMLIARSHMVICRSGATTVSEIGAIGRPAILIPLPGAIDQDQIANAEVLASAGGGWVFPERELGVRRLALELTKLFDHPERLHAAATAAARTTSPEAAERLADVIEKAANKPTGRRVSPAWSDKGGAGG